MINFHSTYLSLFLMAFATQIVVPVPLDIIYISFLAIGFNQILLTFAIISGLTAGASLDYLAGRAGRFLIPAIKGKSHKRFRKAEFLYKKYGKWTLLFSFVPFIGKYFPAVAGFMKTDTITFVVYYVGGKILYYCLILGLYKVFESI